MKRFVFIWLLFFTAACSPATKASTPQVIVDVYATPAAQPWLAKLFDCAPASVTIRLSDSQSDADIRLQLGEPENLASPAYPIGVEDILIVTPRTSPLQNMTLAEVRALFAGQGDLSVQVWVYASGEDLQDAFDQTTMAGRSVSSSARVASSPDQMSEMVNAQSNAVGILPSHLIGNLRFIYTIPDVPVLAVTKTEPNETLKNLIVCLQK